ncbi:MAG: WhiB family transcriptional regulator [Actinomycetia bacterium]|nr:WhiB family transcriptional regulator [Actinomycetes bacterium]MCP4959696.1 WhiB family transcriptional regulator [Actinomycetes bacterium]
MAPSSPGSATNVNSQWQSHAACQGLAADIFYPTSDEESLEAKSVCGDCPAQLACLEHALLVREKDGVWGGATERERRRIIRQRRRAAAKQRALAAAPA